MFKPRNAATEDDTGEREQVPCDIERQAHTQRIPAIELLAIVLTGQGKQFISEQKAEADPPATR